MAFPTSDSKSSQEVLFAEAVQSLREGDRARGKDLLLRLLQQERRNADYWVWMSVAVDSKRERLSCLQNALEIDPHNTAALRGLAIFGVRPPDSALAVPARLQQRGWQRALQMDGADSANHKRQFALLGLAVLALAGIALVVLFSSTLQPRRAAQPTRRATYTAVMDQALAPASETPAPASGPAPLWMLLDATFTATPLYVNTPHAASEAYRIGIRALQRGEWPQAQDYFRQAATDIAQDGSSAPDVLFYLAETNRQRGALPEAQAGFERIIRAAPEFAPAYVGRARVIAAQGAEQLDAAIADLQTALQLDPAYNEAALELASLLLRDNQPEPALRVLASSAALEDLPLAALYRAQAYLALQKPSQAVEAARAANQADPSLLAGYHTLALALQASGQMRASLEPLQVYLRYQPDDAQAWYALAQAQLALQDEPSALKALENAMRLDGQIAGAVLLRAQLYYQQDQMQLALTDFQSAVRQQPSSYAASLGLGMTLLALDEPGKAWDRFERTRALAETDQQNAELLYWRARSLDALGERAAAQRDYTALVNLPADLLEAEWVALARQRIAALTTATATGRAPARSVTPTTRPPIQRTPTPTRTR